MRHSLAAVILLSFMICLRTPLCASAAETAPEAVPGETLQSEEPAGENTEEVTDNSKDGPERSEETSEDGKDSEAVETSGGEEYDTKEDHGAQEDHGGQKDGSNPEDDGVQEVSGNPEDDGVQKDGGNPEDRDDQQPFLDVTGGQADSPEADGTVEAAQKTASDAAQQSVKKISGWQTSGGKKYYYNKDGTKALGVTKIGGVRYLLDPKTGELKTGLVRIDGAYYYGNKEGVMMTGWQTVSGKRYYFTDCHYAGYTEKDEGKRVSGFASIANKRYYLINNRLEGYRESERAVLARGWNTVGGYLYYMDPSTGAIATGFHTVGSKRYCFSETGVIKKYKGWTTVNEGRYYFNKDYSVRRGISSIEGSTYYLHPVTGETVCGWKTINGKKYYFADERYKSYKLAIRGKRLTGFREIGGKTYYFMTPEMSGYKKEDYAARATGWKTIGGKAYYFHEDGHKQETGRVVMNGKMCAFGRGGVCSSKNSSIIDVVTYALKWVGKVPYKSSATGNDPNNERMLELKEGRGSDCSWFVFACLEKYGYLDHHVHSYDWGSKASCYKNGEEIGRDLSKAKPGDIICYGDGTAKRTPNNSHVAIYIGNGRQVECASGKGVVRSGVDRKNIINIVRFGK